MKTIIFFLSFVSFLNFAQSEETTGEKVKVGLNKVGRETTKVVNRTKEAMCGELTGDSKVKCLAQKTKHRVEEGAEVIKDKASEVKNKVD